MFCDNWTEDTQKHILGLFLTIFQIFTTRVRSTREGNIYTWECLSVHHCRGVPHLRSGHGGVPHPRSGHGGYPIPGLHGGTPCSHSGGTWARPRPDLGWSTPPSKPWMGYPPGQTCAGVPPITGWGTLHHHWMGYPPPSEDGVPPPQHSKHLLCSGQYASCVHTGGLSCSI